jgi:hypothetical protein
MVALVLTWGIGAYYNRRFGQVRSLNSPSWKSYLVGLLALISIIAAWAADITFKPPVDILGLTIAVGLALVWLQPAYRPRLHYLAVAILVAAMSLLPLLGLFAGQPTIYLKMAGPLGIVLFLLVGGLFDHLLLVRAFKALPEEESHE